MEPTDESPEHPSTGDDTVIVDPQELLGRTFLMDTQEDGQRFRAHIVECISDHESNVRRSDDHVKFRISVNEDEYKEIITYNELMDFIEKNQENNAIVWQFRRIVGHQGPLLWHDKDIREENLLQMVLWKMVHFALFLVKIFINFSPGYSTVFFSSQCTSLLYNNFKILLQKFQNFCTMF
jgi:hypothetical protein